MKREIIGVEPLSTYLERWNGSNFGCDPPRRHDLRFGFLPFDPETGEVIEASIERQTELVLEQMEVMPGNCRVVARSSAEGVIPTPQRLTRGIPKRSRMIHRMASRRMLAMRCTASIA